jgi:ADP-heptose:LPS heptosyltransferase
MNICIIRADHLGDLVLTTPLMRELHRSGHQVDVVCRAAHLPALDHLPFIHHAHALEAISPGFPARWSDLTAWFRIRKYNRLLLPYAKPKELLFAARMSGTPVTSMWGGLWSRLLLCRSLRSCLLTHPRHMTDIWLDLARDLGCDPQGTMPELTVNDHDKDFAAKWLQDRGIQGSFVIIHPGCGGNTCNLPPAVYAELADFVRQEHGSAVVVTGSTTEKQTIGQAFADVYADTGVVDAMDALDLRVFMALIAQAACVVSVGTGPLHLAAALGTPTVSPFCRRIGISAKVWGNQAVSGIAVEPDEAWCAAYGKNDLCNFNGHVDAKKIFSALSRTLTSCRQDIVP